MITPPNEKNISILLIPFTWCYTVDLLEDFTEIIDVGKSAERGDLGDRHIVCFKEAFCILYQRPH